MMVIVIFVIQIVIVQIGGKSFMLVPLSFDQHLKSILIGVTILPYAYITKIIIPESFLNNFHLLRQERKETFTDVDSIFLKYMKQPITETRNSRHSRRQKKRQQNND